MTERAERGPGGPSHLTQEHVAPIHWDSEMFFKKSSLPENDSVALQSQFLLHGGACSAFSPLPTGGGWGEEMID